MSLAYAVEVSLSATGVRSTQNTVEQALKGIKSAATQAQEAVKNIGLDSNKIRGSVDRALSHVRRFGTQAKGIFRSWTTAAQASMTRFFATMRTGFAAMTATIGRVRSALFSMRGAMAGIGVGIGGAAFLGTVGGFSRTMTGIEAITQASPQEMARLRKQARFMGATTAFTASQAGQAQRGLAMGGMSTGQVLAATPDVLNLATAADMDLGLAGKITANTLGQFNMEANQAGEVADVLAAAASSALTNVEMLGDSLRYAGPVAKAFGLSLNETTAILGAFANAGIQGSMAGTTLRQMISKLANPTSAAKRELDSLAKGMGRTSEAFKLGVQPIREIIANLIEAGATEDQLLRIFDVRGGAGVLALQNQFQEYARLDEIVADPTGRARQMADVMGTSVAHSVLGLKSAIEELMHATGDKGLTGALQGVIDKSADVIRVWSGMTEGFRGSREEAEKLAGQLSAIGNIAIPAWLAKLILGGPAGAAVGIGAGAGYLSAKMGAEEWGINKWLGNMLVPDLATIDADRRLWDKDFVATENRVAGAWEQAAYERNIGKARAAGFHGWAGESFRYFTGQNVAGGVGAVGRIGQIHQLQAGTTYAANAIGQAGMSASGAGIGAPWEANERQIQLIEQANEILARRAPTLSQLKTREAEIVELQERMPEHASALNELLTETRAKMTEITEATLEFDNGLRQAEESLSRTDAAMGGLYDSTVRFNEALTDSRVWSNEFMGLWHGIENQIVQTFVSGEFSARKFFESVFAMIQKLAVEKMIAEPIVAAVSSGVTGLVGGALGGGRSIAAAQAGAARAGQMAAGATMGLPMFAEGGLTGGGRGAFPAVLHPNEAVIPLSGGRRVPVEFKFNNAPKAQQPASSPGSGDAPPVFVQVVNFMVNANDAGSFMRNKGKISAQLRGMAPA